ncbi:Bacteriocin-protection, YdeI or OmpD-Associated [Nakamurella panacisegetis]|uniref:Bacteriocin-protection, YdeI or OmpD-Associated n=1 Tax=Nakamurella panacisegetis TaxID=1090615 RepID=A0A1H0QWI9_9ACTN|nr:YdeI/OmpD-associated family protein [Nakamurella panacisegetis]SDP21662.1 Bacteriocin-protection, YdeI or OmpD-Associated [Nakamurella panacisegetis]
MITATGVAVPDDMAAELSKDPATLAAFEALWPSDQLEFVNWLAKPGAQTRSERLAEISEHVRNHKHRTPTD